MEQIEVAPLDPAHWLQIMEREYFYGWLAGGGATAKFVVADPATHERIASRLAALAEEGRMESVRVGAGETKCHLPQEIFFAIARALPWTRLAQRQIERLFAEHAYPWPRPGEPMALADLAQHFAIVPQQLQRLVDEWLARDLWQDPALAQDFRAAIDDLCRSRLAVGAAAPTVVLTWLTGGKAPLGALRKSAIGGRIHRANARVMLTSLCHWLRKNGSGGLLLILDLRPALLARPDGAALRYSPTMLMDLYEVLREILDEQEGLPGLFLLVQADETLTGPDPRRSLAAYTALEMRLWPDVHPAGRQSPLAPLVELGSWR